MKKTLVICLLLAFAVVLSACGQAPAQTAGAEPEDPKPAAEEPAPQETQQTGEKDPAPQEDAETGTQDPETGTEEPEPPPEPEPEASERELAVTELMSELSAALTDELSGREGRWAVYAEDLETGIIARAEHNVTCAESMVSASMIKIFVMAAAYDAIDRGLFSEDALSGDIYSMVVYSSNEATNELVTLLGGGDPAAGMALVNDYNRSIGCESSRMERLMLVEDGTQNYVSEEDCAKLLRMIWEGTCVSPEYSEKMLSTLKDQYWDDYLNQGAPEGTVIAHKTGDLIGLCQGDVGIVYAPRGPYIVCTICNDAPDYNGNIEVLGRLAGIVYEHMDRRPAGEAPSEDGTPETWLPEEETPEPPPEDELQT